jgi:hypothetical protein
LPFTLALLRDWLAVAVLAIIFVYDLKWMLIPDGSVTGNHH